MDVITTTKAPEAIGTYSQAVKVGNVVYISGQIPLDAQTMEVISGDFEKEVTQVFHNLQAVCRASGGDLKNLVKLTVYMTDLSHFQTVNQVMARFIDTPYPARAAIEVSALPKGVNIEIDGIMVLSA